MAVTVLYNASVTLNAVDVSAQVKSVSLPMTIAQLDATTMGSSTTIFEPGLKGFSCEIEFLNDLTDNLEDEDFHALWDARTKFAVVIRVDAGTIGAANPEYRFTGFISSWNPVQGSVGDLAGGSMTITNSTALTRAVA